MADATAVYQAWAAKVKAQGGTVTNMPSQAGYPPNTPAAKYSAAQIAKLKLGEPQLWSAKKVYGYYAATATVTDSARAVDDKNATPKDSPSWWDNLFHLGDSARSIGTVIFWVAIAVVVLIGLAVVFEVREKVKEVIA